VDSRGIGASAAYRFIGIGADVVAIGRLFCNAAEAFADMGSQNESNMGRNKQAMIANNESNCQQLYRLAKSLIPGGTQLLSKRPEMFAPDQWPGYYREAHGCEVVDFDGRQYIDMAQMGIGSCLLGYADPDVTDAVVARVKHGSMCTLNNPEEVELAQLMLSIHPWAQQIRFGRTGGEAMAIAVRIARAHTGRDVVAFCGYHGWHDWYLAANRSAQSGGDSLKEHLLPGLSASGVPSQLAGTALPFKYNDVDSLAKIVEQQGNRLAAVVMETTRNSDPAPGFLAGVRELCERTGAVLVFDEITIGWRLNIGGAHLRFGVNPDVAVFAKATGNGHPVAAILGRAEVMQAAQGSFISSTYWTEGVGPTAALATVRKFQRVDVPSHIATIGARLREGVQETAARESVPLKMSGFPCLTYFRFDHPEALALQTLLTVRMLRHGILAGGGFYPSLAHASQHVDCYLAAAEEVLAELGQAIRQGDVLSRIGGPVRHSGFARLA
jgi:glutamate-1-semialdehyde 2,1-aminomutase